MTSFIKRLALRIEKILLDHSWVGRLLALVGGMICVYIYSRKLIRDPTNGDVGVYLNAARVMLDGGNIYEVSTNPGTSVGLFYLYPPLLAFLFIPFTFIPTDVAVIMWTVANVVLVVWIVKALAELLSDGPISALSARDRLIVCILPLLFTARFVANNLQRGQINILEIALVVFALMLTKGGSDTVRSIVGGGAIGISIVLKLLTAPMVLLFLLNRRIVALAGIFGGVVLGCLVPALWFGWSYNLFSLEYWVQHFLLVPDRVDASLLQKFDFSVRGQLYRFFHSPMGYYAGDKIYSLKLFSLSSSAIEALDWLFRLMLLLPVVHYWSRYRKAPRLIREYGLAALLFALAPFFFPTTQMNYLVFLLPTYVYIFFVWRSERLRDIRLTVFVAASFLFLTLAPDRNLPFYFGHFAEAAGCYIWGTVFLVLGLFRSVRLLKKLNTNGTRIVAE